MRRLALALLLAASASAAKAEHDARASGSSAPLFVRLTPSPSALHLARVTAREQRLARLIGALPDVDAVAAQLTVPEPHGAPLDRPLAAPRCALVLRVRAPGPSDDALFTLARAELPELARTDFVVSRHPRLDTPAPTLVRLGPFEVAAGSASGLRLALGLSLAANALLSSFLVWRTRAARRAARPHDR